MKTGPTHPEAGVPGAPQGNSPAPRPARRDWAAVTLHPRSSRPWPLAWLCPPLRLSGDTCRFECPCQAQCVAIPWLVPWLSTGTGSCVRAWRPPWWPCWL